MSGAHIFLQLLCMITFFVATWTASKLSSVVSLPAMLVEIGVGILLGPSAAQLIGPEYAVCESRRFKLCALPPDFDLSRTLAHVPLGPTLGRIANMDYCPRTVYATVRPTSASTQASSEEEVAARKGTDRLLREDVDRTNSTNGTNATNATMSLSDPQQGPVGLQGLFSVSFLADGWNPPHPCVFPMVGVQGFRRVFGVTPSNKRCWHCSCLLCLSAPQSAQRKGSHTAPTPSASKKAASTTSPGAARRNLGPPPRPMNLSETPFRAIRATQGCLRCWATLGSGSFSLRHRQAVLPKSHLSMCN